LIVGGIGLTLEFLMELEEPKEPVEFGELAALRGPN